MQCFQKLTTVRKAGLTVALSALLLCSFATISHAWVDITSPDSDSLVSGTITIKATVNNEWWSELVVDGQPIVSATTGSVSFQWNTASVADGPHWVVVKGFPEGKPADSSASITVSVLNHRSADLSRHFGTLSATDALPGGSWCREVIPWETEMVSTNTPNNNTIPTSSQLTSYAANGYAANVYNGKWAYARVNGHYTGTTDMILRWTACKWGIDEDVVRAQTSAEHWNWDQNRPGDMRTSYSQCVNENFTSLWDFECQNCCWQTWSTFQVKVYYDWQTWPMMLTSTPFAADFRYADQRACMNGDLQDYFATFPETNGHTYAADIASGNLNTILWGCIGSHYSGKWYDGNSTGGAIWYINLVQKLLAEKYWKMLWPDINWPD